MRIITDTKLNFDDVLLVPQRTTINSRKDVILEREFQFYHSTRKWKGIPICCSNMTTISSPEMAEKLSEYKMITCLHKFYTLDELCDIFIKKQLSIDYTWVSIGKSHEDIKKISELTRLLGRDKSPNIVIDVPNAYIESFVDFCSSVRATFPNSIIMAGNVVTSDMSQELIISGGVDIVKLFIGPGANCLTSNITGVGYPTFSCTTENAYKAHGLKSGEKKIGLICPDGGFSTVGNIAKGFAAGADFIMLGNMFAGTEQCTQADWENNEMIHYGMSSKYAQDKNFGGYKEYRASEGKITKISNKGCVSNIIQEILGGLRSTATYIGAKSLKDFHRCAEFIRIK